MNILDDVIEMQSTTLAQKPFNEVDSLIFSALAYFPFEDLSLKDGTKFCEIDEKNIVIPDKTSDLYKNHYNLLKAIVKSQRYADFAIYDYENIFCQQSEKQFAAVCFVNKDFVYVSFRGTDSTVTGWKEDANMSFLKSVPAQEEAKLYLKKIHIFQQEATSKKISCLLFYFTINNNLLIT